MIEPLYLGGLSVANMLDIRDLISLDFRFGISWRGRFPSQSSRKFKKA